MGLEIDLKKETEKWLKKIEREMKKMELKGRGRKRLLKNINAYIRDSKYFLENGELIKAFEAVIYAYGILDAAIEAEILQTKANQ